MLVSMFPEPQSQFVEPDPRVSPRPADGVVLNCTVAPSRAVSAVACYKDTAEAEDAPYAQADGCADRYADRDARADVQTGDYAVQISKHGRWEQGCDPRGGFGH